MNMMLSVGIKSRHPVRKSDLAGSTPAWCTKGLKSRKISFATPSTLPCVIEYLRSLFAMGRLIILSGPSCVGKGPLHTAFHNFYPERAANLQKLVLYNCRAPRTGEIDGKDYHFRSREEIDGFREKENFVVLDVRGDLQAVDLKEVERALSAGICSSRAIRSLAGNC
jgi:hypothetical protein